MTDAQEEKQQTNSLIRKSVSVDGKLGILPLYEINRSLTANISERVKVTNLYWSLIVHFKQHQAEQLFSYPSPTRWKRWSKIYTTG